LASHEQQSTVGDDTCASRLKQQSLLVRRVNTHDRNHQPIVESAGASIHERDVTAVGQRP
jgi:hypothetical protein